MSDIVGELLGENLQAFGTKPREKIREYIDKGRTVHVYWKEKRLEIRPINIEEDAENEFER